MVAVILMGLMTAINFVPAPIARLPLGIPPQFMVLQAFVIPFVLGLAALEQRERRAFTKAAAADLQRGATTLLVSDGQDAPFRERLAEAARRDATELQRIEALGGRIVLMASRADDMPMRSATSSPSNTSARSSCAWPDLLRRGDPCAARGRPR